MFKKITLAIILSLTTSSSIANNQTSYLIDNKDYTGLKKHLYFNQPDVLDRTEGRSSLDHAIAKKDQRAAIILADYNNSTMSQRRLRSVELKLKNLNEKLKNQPPKDADIKIMIEKLESERIKITTEIRNESNKAVNLKIAEMESRIKKLEDMAMPLDIKKAVLKSNRSFLNEEITLEIEKEEKH